MSEVLAFFEPWSLERRFDDQPTLGTSLLLRCGVAAVDLSSGTQLNVEQPSATQSSRVRSRSDAARGTLIRLKQASKAVSKSILGHISRRRKAELGCSETLY